MGLLNSRILSLAIQKESLRAKYVALGGALPEAIYMAIAFAGISTCNNYFSGVRIWLDVFASVLFLIIGISLWLQKPKFNNPNTVTHQRNTKEKIGYSTEGFLLGISNPQLLPFWAGVLLYLPDLLTDNYYLNLFGLCAGAAVGAFVWHLLLVKLTSIKALNLTKNLQVTYRILGLGFVAFGLWKLAGIW